MPDYGRGGAKWADHVRELIGRVGGTTVLDYGCGKGLLAKELRPIDVREYDPAVPGKDAEPASADIVVCTDVLEHVEPDCLDDVLDDLDRLSRRALLINISMQVGRRKLPDGRPAHILIRSGDWWQAKLERFGEREPVDTKIGSIAGIYIRDWRSTT